MNDDMTEQVVAVNRGAEQSDRAAPSRGEAHRALAVMWNRSRSGMAARHVQRR